MTGKHTFKTRVKRIADFAIREKTERAISAIAYIWVSMVLLPLQFMFADCVIWLLFINLFALVHFILRKETLFVALVSIVFILHQMAILGAGFPFFINGKILSILYLVMLGVLIDLSKKYCRYLAWLKESYDLQQVRSEVRTCSACGHDVAPLVRVCPSCSEYLGDGEEGTWSSYSTDSAKLAESRSTSFSLKELELDLKLFSFAFPSIKVVRRIVAFFIIATLVSLLFIVLVCSFS